MKNLMKYSVNHRKTTTMKSCCRCLVSLDESDGLGGSYGGIVCLNHRVCPDCWWKSDTISVNKGRRGTEVAPTRGIALVHNPRKNATIKCYGCFYKITLYVPKTTALILEGTGLYDSPIIIN